MMNAIVKEKEINDLDDKEMDEDAENCEEAPAVWSHTKPKRD